MIRLPPSASSTTSTFHTTTLRPLLESTGESRTEYQAQERKATLWLPLLSSFMVRRAGRRGCCCLPGWKGRAWAGKLRGRRYLLVGGSLSKPGRLFDGVITPCIRYVIGETRVRREGIGADRKRWLGEKGNRHNEMRRLGNTPGKQEFSLGL